MMKYMAIMRKKRSDILQFLKRIDGILGDIRGKVGGYTVYKMMGKKIYRRLPQRLSPPSPAQKAQRKKFAILQSLSKVFLSLVPQTLQLRKKLKPACAFIKVNQSLVRIDRATKKVEVDYTQLDLTGQNDFYWLSPRIADFHKNTLTIQWKVDPIDYEVFGQPNSPKEKPPQIHFVLFCPAKSQFQHLSLPVGQESQEVLYPRAWEGKLIYLYSFIQKGRRFTVTRCVGSLRNIRHVGANPPEIV
jgi:hypothetical protein